jgi:hypothetical protein
MTLHTTASLEPSDQDAFTSTLDLVNRYGTDAVIEAITEHARFEAEDEELDLYCRLLAGRRHLELEQLTERQIHFEEVVDNLIMPEAEVTDEGR